MFIIPLVTARFGHFDHHKANAIQILKRLVTCRKIKKSLQML